MKNKWDSCGPLLQIDMPCKVPSNVAFLIIDDSPSAQEKQIGR